MIRAVINTIEMLVWKNYPLHLTCRSHSVFKYTD